MTSSRPLFVLLLAALVASSLAAYLPGESGHTSRSDSTTDFMSTSPPSTTTTTSDPKSNFTTTTNSTSSDNSDDSSSIEFTSQQNTSTFTCNGKVTGYYADVKLQCRVYHFCTQLEGLEGDTYQRMSYLCLEDSFFDQKDLNCVKRADMKVPCDKAEAEYERSNKQFDAREESAPSMSDSLTANIMMNPIARYIAGR